MTKFETFCACNTDVIKFIVEQAKLLRARGYKSIGFRVLWESARLYGLGRRTPGEKWALNNNYCPELQRLIEDQEPTLRGFFKHRTAKCDALEDEPTLSSLVLDTRRDPDWDEWEQRWQADCG